MWFALWICYCALGIVVLYLDHILDPEGGSEGVPLRAVVLMLLWPVYLLLRLCGAARDRLIAYTFN